jgi:light-regulated signal transduction histidine kinase (bacteriophytochrome)
LYGNTPARAQVMELASWLAEQQNDVFHSDNVGRDIPQLALGTVGSGVLAVSISEIHPNFLIWFKPERSQIVKWAGRPDKTIADSGSLSPRQSFEQWQQIVEGFSTPWNPSEIEGVQELRLAILGIVLRKAEELAQLSEDLERSNKELEAFSYSVSHDLRAPLRHIAGYAELLTEMEGPTLSERGRRFLSTIEESARFAGTLVDNLLSFSQMGRSAMRFTDVNLSAVIASIQAEMAPDYEGREIEWTFESLPVVVADPAFLHLALRNLIANAIKYTRNQPAATIEVTVQERDTDTVISVRDNGVGFDMQYVGKLFGVFQRLHRMEEFEGTGIGLANVRRIVERHGGTVWALGEVGKGATFYISLPKRTLRPTA